MSIWKDFRDFALKGNIIDLATAVVMGGAFGKIVSSFVDDVLMPPIGYLMGGVDFKDLKWVIKSAGQQGGSTASEVAVRYGSFLQTIVDFLIISFCIFIMIRLINKLQNKKEKEVEEQPTKDQALLTEIRDLLKNK